MSVKPKASAPVDYEMLRYHMLQACHDWESGRFECVRIPGGRCLRFPLTPVIQDLIILLVHARIGRPTSVPDEDYSYEGELHVLAALGYLKRFTKNDFRARQIVEQFGAVKASELLGYPVDIRELPRKRLQALYNTSVQSPSYPPKCRVRRWRFHDGAEIGFFDYNHDANSFTRHFEIHSRIVMCAVLDPEGIWFHNPANCKREPGSAGWREDRERSDEVFHYAITRDGLRYLEVRASEVTPIRGMNALPNFMPLRAESKPSFDGEAGDSCPAEQDTGIDATAIPDRIAKVARQFEEAAMALGEPNPRDQDAYKLLKATYERSGEVSDLHNFPTWERYLRQYRQLTGTRKKRPRTKRLSGSGSIVSYGEVNPNELPTRIRPLSADEGAPDGA